MLLPRTPKHEMKSIPRRMWRGFDAHMLCRDRQVEGCRN